MLIATLCESPVRVFVSGVSLFMLFSPGVTRIARIRAHSPSTSTLLTVGILIGTGRSVLVGSSKRASILASVRRPRSLAEV